MPITCVGRKWSRGKKNPVALVSAVVARNSAVHGVSFFEPNMPSTTMKPERIPIRLRTTCTKVKVDTERSRIETRLLI